MPIVRPAARQRPTTRCGTSAASRRKSQRRSTAIHDPGLDVLERVPPGGVDAGRERAAVQERPWLVAAERRRGRIEPQDDGVLEKLDRHEPDRSVER